MRRRMSQWKMNLNNFKMMKKMNNFIKNIIEETFASKAQQRYFYAQAGKGGKKGKKWAKWAKEFSDKTDFKKIPEKVEKEK